MSVVPISPFIKRIIVAKRIHFVVCRLNSVGKIVHMGNTVLVKRGTENIKAGKEGVYSLICHTELIFNILFPVIV